MLNSHLNFTEPGQAWVSKFNPHFESDTSQVSLDHSYQDRDIKNSILEVTLSSVPNYEVAKKPWIFHQTMRQFVLLVSTTILFIFIAWFAKSTFSIATLSLIE